ncbi:hypothetical protein EZS27_018284 [termite gut metagenome]|uniref:Uncharacterized protein n=1 Tax=termite gut metagenome TaxID=433724 RepID=A0A5J4RI50_9ZZZZ
MSKEEYNNILEAIDVLYNYENLKRLYEIVALNNNELIKFVMGERDSLIKNSLSVVGDKEAYYFHYLNVNRFLLNYLSSLRTLIDHIESAIKRKFGNTSNEQKIYKEKLKEMYDKYFSYRFFYKLRNYSQHCGLPIEEIEMSATIISENEIKPEYKVEFKTKDLLDKYKEWGTNVKKDLEERESFSLFPLLEEMGIIIENIFNFILNSIYKSRILKSIEYLEQHAGHLKGTEHKVCIFSNIVFEDNGSPKYFQTLAIPFDIIENIGIFNCT